MKEPSPTFPKLEITALLSVPNGFGEEASMQLSGDALTNHEVTICLQGGAELGPFNATWSKESNCDVRDLCLEYDGFLKGESQKRFKFHLHDTVTNTVHTVILRFENVTAIYDHVKLRPEDQASARS